MTITISSKKAGTETLYEGLAEARMDEESKQLSTHKEGICSVGQASCYALIVRNSTDSVLWHICIGLDACGKETRQAINNLKSAAPNDEVNIILVRSKASFAEDQAEEKLHNPNDTYETVEQYMKNTDDEYLKELAKNLKRFNIIPQFIDMPHDFLVINSKNELCLFEQYTTDEIKWVNVKPNKKAKKDHQPSTQENTPASSSSSSSFSGMEREPNTFFRPASPKEELQGDKSENLRKRPSQH
ncbi:MAG: hypothetical protein P4L65_10820 [Legionella sp.]|nr:hypothetical protein [Legionella sp.]